MEKILSKDDKISEAIEVEEVTMSNKDITIRKESFIEAGNIRAENKQIRLNLESIIESQKQQIMSDAVSVGDEPEVEVVQQQRTYNTPPESHPKDLSDAGDAQRTLYTTIGSLQKVLNGFRHKNKKYQIFQFLKAEVRRSM